MDTGHCRELVGLVKLRSKGPAVFVGSIDAASLRLNVIVVHGSEMTPRERSLVGLLKMELIVYVLLTSREQIVAVTEVDWLLLSKGFSDARRAVVEPVHLEK